MNKINVIQFLPYFPPHKWWLETHAKEWSFWWEKKWYWNVINITFWDKKYLSKIKNIKPDNLFIIPAFDLIPNFPIPIIWKKDFWSILKLIRDKDIIDINKNTIIITRTRFFISSLLWWIFAKINKIKWCHIEHWSDFVKLNSKIKSSISYFYDKIIGKWIIKHADFIVCVSNWSKEFVLKNFSKRKIDVIYRWIDFYKIWELETISKKNDKIHLWFIWRLVKLKWIDLLLKAVKNIIDSWEKNIHLSIIWEWEEKNNLKKIIHELWISNFVKFEWEKEREDILNNYLPKIDILINPSYQEWMPTVVTEWLFRLCYVIASNVWWTKEISNKWDLLLFESWNIDDLTEKLKFWIKNFKKFTWESKEDLLEKFDWNKNIEKYFDIFK